MWKWAVVTAVVCWAGVAGAECLKPRTFGITNAELVSRIASQGLNVRLGPSCTGMNSENCGLMIEGFPNMAVGTGDECFEMAITSFNEAGAPTRRKKAVSLAKIILRAIGAPKDDIDAMGYLLHGETAQQHQPISDKNSVPDVDCCYVATVRNGTSINLYIDTPHWR